MKKLLLFLLFTVPFSTLVFANDEIDGIAYGLNSDGTAQVVKKNPSYSGVVSIPEQVYYDGENRAVTKIGTKAFRNCGELTSVEIPQSVKSIDNYAFSGSSLKEIAIPNSVTEIGGYTFQDCKGLERPVYNEHIFVALPRSYNGSYSIPDGIEVIAYGAFDECAGLTEVIIPSSVREIGKNAFKGCTSLTSVVIPDGVEKIGAEAFSGCTSLTNVVLPNSVKEVDDYVFKGCVNLAEPIYNDKLFVAMPRSHEGLFRVPAGIETIVEEAFKDCSASYQVILPNSVTTIGNDAFAMSGLSEIRLSENLKKIGDCAFMSCLLLQTITIPASVEEIGGFAFAACSGLTSITCDAINPPALGAAVFNAVNKSIPLYVPEEAIDAYRNADQWKEFNIMPIDDWNPDHPANPGNYLLTLIAEPEEWGTFEGDGLYEQNSEVEFTAIANHGYRFVKWTDGVEDATRTIKLVRDTTFTALFELNEFLIKFNNYNDTLLEEKLVTYGTTPVYTGEEPKHDPTDEFAFFFKGWEPEIVPVYDEATYTAVFDSLAYPDTVIIGDKQNLSEMFVGPITHVIALETAEISIPTPVKVKSLTLWVSNIDAPSIDGIENLTAETVDMVLRLEPYEDVAVRSKWYAFAVPFNVEVSSGIRVETEEDPAVLGRKFILDQYDGTLRSDTQNGWERVSADATLVPGVTYMISVNGTDNYWRFTMSGSTPIEEHTSIDLSAYPSQIGQHHAGWNSLSNISWQKSKAVAEGVLYATIYHNDLSVYEVVPLDEYEFFAFCPIFIQAPGEGVVNFLPVGNADGPNNIQRRTYTPSPETSSPMKFSLETDGQNYADKSYITLTSAEKGYTIGHDLQKMVNRSAAVAQMWISAYGLDLAAHEATLVDRTTTVPVGFYAPTAGTYRLSVSGVDSDVQVYLAHKGNVIWDLLASDCDIQLPAGDTKGYSIIIYKKSALITPSYDVYKQGIKSDKIIKDGVVYVRHGNKVFDAHGKRTVK